MPMRNHLVLDPDQLARNDLARRDPSQVKVMPERDLGAVDQIIKRKEERFALYCV
jgi:hypothetical protein